MREFWLESGQRFFGRCSELAMASLSSLVLAEGERDAAGRARLQSYEAMPLFLPSRLWRQILDCERQAAASGKAAAPGLDEAFQALVPRSSQIGASAKKRPAAAKGGPVKRPAAGSGVLRRPAAAELSAARASASADSVLRRPAAAGPAAAAETREELLARVPQEMKDRFAKGCSTCRWRPLCCVSCWRKRGF